MKKKDLYIVTANDYLLYQPTILNVYDELEKHFTVTIISFEPHFISKQKDETRRTEYINIPAWLRFFVQNTDYGIQLSYKALRRVGLRFNHRHSYFQRLQVFFLDQHVASLKPDLVIAVDIAALFVCQKYFDTVDFLSLEIYEDDPLQEKIDLDRIASVFIQNEPRYDHFFGSKKIPTFFVQNAPTFKEAYLTSYERKGLVWAGSIVRKFAVLDSLAFIERYPSYQLTLKGGGERKTLKYIRERYFSQLSNGQLKIDQVYLSNDQFIDYLSHFRIGFCFYSWDLIRSSINYQTAPSGKLFMCLAAGVPVIASNIPGFQFVKDHQAGVLIDDYAPETIFKAIEKIEQDYINYSNHAYQLAQLYSFDKRVLPYIEYLKER